MDITYPTPHLEKLNAALKNDKLPKRDISSLKKALKAYQNWINLMETVPDVKQSEGITTEEVVHQLVDALNQYKLYIDLQVIFDSAGDFLYRQKGQLKFDNTIIEEFLPYLVYKTIPELADNYVVGPQSSFSAMYFESSLGHLQAGGGPRVRKKDQDFAISQRLLIRTSHEQDCSKSIEQETYLAYIIAECKTNLDKTMYQEATATAHDAKIVVPGAKYYLLCEWLDMTPISTASTDIDEVMILRKAKRISSNIRKHFSTVEGRAKARADFEKFLTENPFDAQVFLRLVNHITQVWQDEAPIESDVLETGYF